MTTDENGVAMATLTSSQSGNATVVSSVNEISESVIVSFTSQSRGPLRQPEPNEIPIYTAADLAKIGVDPQYPLNDKYIQMADIDLSEYSNWNPIKDYFRGTFDGNGFVIKNLKINRPKEDYQDLFNRTFGATIQNVGLINVDVVGKYYVGAPIGLSRNSNIVNCYSIGNVSGAAVVGGLIGETSSDSQYSYNIIQCSYSGGTASGQYNCVGGLVGRNRGYIRNSYSTSKVTGFSYVGGLVGENAYHQMTSIMYCYSVGEVSGTEDVGGLVGYNAFAGGHGGIDYSLWDIETSKTTNYGNINPMYGNYGKTTAEMKMKSTFVKWDFDNVWTIDEGQSYPYLRTNEQIPHPGTN